MSASRKTANQQKTPPSPNLKQPTGQTEEKNNEESEGNPQIGHRDPGTRARDDMRTREGRMICVWCFLLALGRLFHHVTSWTHLMAPHICTSLQRFTQCDDMVHKNSLCRIRVCAFFVSKIYVVRPRLTAQVKVTRVSQQ